MKFGLLVSEGPYTHQASDTAYNFAAAATANNQKIHGVIPTHQAPPHLRYKHPFTCIK